MNELDGAAPGQPDTAAPSNAAANPGPKAGNGAAAVQGWLAALDEDTRRTVDAKGWSKLRPDEASRAILGSYVELQKKAGLAFHLPKADAPAAEKDAARAHFLDALGRPKTPDEIAFRLSANMPEGLVYDEAFANEAKPILHKWVGDPEGMQILHDLYVSHAARQAGAMAEQIAEREASATAALQRAWGTPDSAQHRANLAFVNRAIREGGGEAVMTELKSYGLLGAEGEVRAPAFATMLATLAERAFGEPAAPGGGEPPPAPRAIANRLFPNLS